VECPASGPFLELLIGKRTNHGGRVAKGTHAVRGFAFAFEDVCNALECCGGVVPACAQGSIFLAGGRDPLRLSATLGTLTVSHGDYERKRDDAEEEPRRNQLDGQADEYGLKSSGGGSVPLPVWARV
jgi:hypothetical protein